MTAITSRIEFDRKHYSYPDLPHGYQITQKRNPLARGGQLKHHTIEEIHLEIDTGRNVSGGSGIDLNRAGTALIEVEGCDTKVIESSC